MEQTHMHLDGLLEPSSFLEMLPLLALLSWACLRLHLQRGGGVLHLYCRAGEVGTPRCIDHVVNIWSLMDHRLGA